MTLIGRTLLAALALTGWLGSSPAAAQSESVEVEAADILADPEAWEGRRLSVIGELVGDYSRRPEGVWVQLNDDPYVEEPMTTGGTPAGANVGLGARIPTDLFDTAVTGDPGRYAQRGPVVLITGEYRANDPRLGGESYLEVSSIELLAAASELERPGPDIWLGIGIALVLAAALAATATRRGGNQEKTTRSSRWIASSPPG